ncbi:hypothetical protein DFP72DRAFT_312336 [Ephemerocybe angulata]|uniref:Uncharacterized protein n=1 Tax=Ephemerocybe angulata TaxID=980116 RepID=A0A8H6I1C6_9AGAR|nr:hypothetical protein DFP72DRAFT_312336 [Tulosesus angulatus]
MFLTSVSSKQYANPLSPSSVSPTDTPDQPMSISQPSEQWLPTPVQAPTEHPGAVSPNGYAHTFSPNGYPDALLPNGHPDTFLLANGHPNAFFPNPAAPNTRSSASTTARCCADYRSRLLSSTAAGSKAQLISQGPSITSEAPPIARPLLVTSTPSSIPEFRVVRPQPHTSWGSSAPPSLSS